MEQGGAGRRDRNLSVDFLLGGGGASVFGNIVLWFHGSCVKYKQVTLNSSRGPCTVFGLCGVVCGVLYMPVPEIIDPVFAKTSQNARFLVKTSVLGLFS